MFRYFVDKFWSEDVWLPQNTTWADVAPGPDKTVVYPYYADIFSYPIPLALVLIIVRFMLNKYCFIPLGKLLCIKNTRPKKALNNPILETAYKTLSKVNHNQICALAKQLDMTERQVERWWRLRRVQDAPSTLVKFCENMWGLTFYVCNISYALYILWDKEWLWDLDQCYIGYPHQGITSGLWCYYMSTLALVWSSIMTLFVDVRHKDFWLLIVHHVATIALFVLSWFSNLHRLGSLVILVHDSSETLLFAAKAAKYANYHRLCDVIFILFTVIWFIARLWIFPFYLIWSSCIRAPMLLPMFPVFYIIIIPLCTLMLLHIIWTWFILQVLYKAIIAGKVDSDIRSSNSDVRDSSSQSTRNTLKHVNQKRKEIVSRFNRHSRASSHPLTETSA